MFGSTARSACIVVAAVVTAGCGFKAAGVGTSPVVDAGSQAGTGGQAGKGGGAGTTATGGTGGTGGKPTLIIDGGVGGGGNVTGSLDANCGTKTQTAKMVPPDIMLVMDRSLSMTNDVNDRPCAGGTGMNGNCGAASKWQIVLPVLSALVTGTNTKVNWGMFYLGNEPTMCGVATAPVVPVAAMNAAAVTAALTSNLFNGQVGTPTRRAIQGAVAALTALTDQNPKYILLATDGQPNCSTATNLMDDSAGTQQAVADALAMNIPTFVVGIGNTNAAATLNATAIAGGRPQMGGTTSYYQVNDAAALTSALATIVGQTASCMFNIGPAPDGTSATGLGVFGDGAKISMDPANGWSFTDASMTAITLNGSICEQVLSGAVKDVTVAFVCVPS